MLLLNFSHPLTPAQLTQLEALIGNHPEGAAAAVERVIAVPAQFDAQQPFVPQVETMLAQVPLMAEEWRRGTPPAQRWDGHEDRIGSPRPAGLRLKGDEVLAIVRAAL
jgi:hypothetical protein